MAFVEDLYATYAHDKANNTWEAPSFKDAVRQHKMFDRIVSSSEAFFS